MVGGCRWDGATFPVGTDEVGTDTSSSGYRVPALSESRVGALVAIQSTEVAEYLGDRVLAVRLRPDVTVTGQAALAPGETGRLSFASRRDPETAARVAQCRSSLLLVIPEYFDFVPESVDVIAVEQPRREFARVVTKFFRHRPVTGVHPSAVVHPLATLGSEVSVGPGAVISEDVTVGDRAFVGPNSVLLPGTVLGDDVEIGPGTVIGHTGFGYVREDDGTPVLVPHVGGVVIGDRVEVGANTAIDRGTIGDTVIEDDTKIDNLVHIAHNCHIGQGAYVIATAILCGGVQVGPGAWVAPNVAVREQLTIGENATIGLSATVTRDVAEGAVVMGSPARELKRP